MNLTKIINSISNAEKYIVGGAIRDVLLKRKVEDIDLIILSSIPETKNFSIKLARELESQTFPLDEQRGIWRITIKKTKLNIDISPIENDIKTDLNKRDFTINSLAINLNENIKIEIKDNFFKIKGIKTSKIIDFNNGIKDLKNKKIRINNTNSFKEDPLRLLRAFRFSALLGFSIDHKTLDEIKTNEQLIKNVAGERIREEIMKIFSSDESFKQIKKMGETNILFTLFPELMLQKKCAEIYYGKGGVLKHTLTVLNRMDFLLSKPKLFFANYRNLNITENDKKLLKLSALLHDIAKPHTAKIINNRLRFFGHEEFGAKIATEIMQKLRFSNEDIKFVYKIIASHLRIGNLAHNEKISDRAIFRLFSDLGKYTIPLFILSFADYASYISEKTLIKKTKILKQKPIPISRNSLSYKSYRKTIRFMQVTNLLIKQYFKKQSQFNEKNLITGHDVMSTLGIKEGPQVGYILKKVRILQFEGKLTTKKQAIEYIKTLEIGLKS